MRFIAPLLVSSVLVAGCAATKPESVRTLLERSGQSQPKLSAYEVGKRHLAAGNSGLAVDSFQAALKDDPQSILALNGLAIAYDRLGRADAAQRFLDRALALEPGSVVTLNNVGYLNLVQGNTEIAHAYSERAKIAAALPTDMILAQEIVGAVSKNAEIADHLVRKEAQDRSSAVVPNLPPESNVTRLGLNEWEVHIRPFIPGRTVLINSPADSIPAPQVPAKQRLSIPESVMDLLTGSEVDLSNSAPAESVNTASQPEPSPGTLATPMPSVAAIDASVAPQPSSGSTQPAASSMVEPSTPAVAAAPEMAMPLSLPIPMSEVGNASVAPMESRTSIAPHSVVPADGVNAGWTATVPLGTKVRVSNGTGRRLMATRFAAYFAEHGVAVHTVANANTFEHKRSTIFYNPDQREFAVQLAGQLPFGVRLTEASQGRGQIELVIGLDLLSFDSDLGTV